MVAGPVVVAWRRCRPVTVVAMMVTVAGAMTRIIPARTVVPRFVARIMITPAGTVALLMTSAGTVAPLVVAGIMIASTGTITLLMTSTGTVAPLVVAGIAIRTATRAATGSVIARIVRLLGAVTIITSAALTAVAGLQNGSREDCDES